MTLTSREKKFIRSTTKLLIKDIRKLTKNYPESEILVFAFNENIGNYGNEWYLKITYKEIELIEKRKDSNSLIARRNVRNMALDEHDYIAQYYLIKNYKEIRESIETIVNERLKKIADNIEMMNETKNAFLRKQKEEKKKKKATIEIEVPPTNNQYQLEVTEENGTTLGKLNFNGLTLKIIASDGIKIVNKTTSKQKIMK